MPNTPVRAAAEGMSDYPRNPQSKGFVRNLLMGWSSRASDAPATSEQERFMNQHVNRRNVFASSAAMAAAAIPFESSNAEPVEAPLDKVNRLARELSLAMDDWMADLGGAKDEFVAEIFPSKAREFPIGFRHNLGDWSPDEELVSLAQEFKEAEAKWCELRDQCDVAIGDFEEKHGLPADHCPTKDYPEYWEERHVECDPLINASADAAEVCDGIRKRLHAIPAKTIAGIAAKAQTLRFDTGLYPEEPERLMKDWDWDVECLHLFVQEASAMAASFDARFGRAFTTGLIPTGRGSYVPAGSISLTEILRRYDLAAAEGESTMPREDVIASFAAAC
ncbi:MAG: hypothetical protein E5V41_12800 [Mesorhizobium sp.]|nr:MAG: hypothetical protein E5V41_12800 [Mesorhizobium sp.]